MHVLVIGAGIIASHRVRTARRGFEVTVVDRRAGVRPGSELRQRRRHLHRLRRPVGPAGHAGQILGYLWRSHSPVIYRPGLAPAQWRWVVRWLGECRLQRFRVNKQRMQRLAEYSRTVLHELRRRHSIDYEQAQGWLQLFRSEADMARAKPSLDMLAQAGSPHRLISAEQCAHWSRRSSTARRWPAGCIFPRKKPATAPTSPARQGPRRDAGRPVPLRHGGYRAGHRRPAASGKPEPAPARSPPTR